MKKTLKEDLERIHHITYSTINEQEFINSLYNKAKDKIKSLIDDPKKADLVSDDLQQFYNTLEQAAKSGGLKEQPRGSMTYQKGVESMQIGLILLGYQLPKYGVDGLFGPETKLAVSQFINSNKILNESPSNELRSTLDSLGYDEKNDEISSGGEITPKISEFVTEILKQYKQTNPSVKVTVTSGNDDYHKNIKSYTSTHTTGQAIDITIRPYNNETSTAFLKILNQFVAKDSKFSFIDEYRNPSPKSTGGHYHLQYTEKESQQVDKTISATPEMLNKLIELLKSKNITSEDLKRYIDTTKTAQPTVEISNWQSYVDTVIDNIEGGYFHPNMIDKGIIRDQRYRNSGETMFGLDRQSGNNEATQSGKMFWDYVDSLNAKHKWPWNYMAKDNPAVNEKLKTLAGAYIKDMYTSYSSKYLTLQSVNFIKSSPGLTLNMIIATWNGPGWFKEFASIINDNIDNATPEQINQMINNKRASANSSLIKQKAEKIKQLTNNI
jgi:peptidoglycan hydrolase-like protein with peptidoglycan-binding domain